MKRFVSVLAVVLVAAAWSPAFSGPCPLPPDPELRALQEEAVSLALFRELSLTADQRTAMREILDPFRRQIDEGRDRVLAWQNRTMKPHLKAVIADLKAGRHPADLTPEAAEIHRELHRFRVDMEIQAEAVMKRLRDVLAAEQVARIDVFHPMDELGLPGPTLFPGFGTQQGPVALLDEIRNASEEEFQQIIGRLRSRMEKERPSRSPRSAGPFADERRKMRKERETKLIELMNNVRTMPQDEYDDRLDILQAEIRSLAPGRLAGNEPGKNGMRGPGPRERGMGPGMGNGPGRPRPLQQIIFSDAFYHAL